MRIRFAVIVAILAVLAAACDGGGSSPEPSVSKPAPSPSSTAPSTAPSGPLTTGPGVQPGEKPPVLTDAAKRHAAAGALAFATYYIRALDWSFATNDSYLLEQVSSPLCPACNRYIAALDGLKAGERLTGSRITIVSSRTVTGTFRVKSDAVLEFVLNDEAAVVTGRSSPPTTVAPAARNDRSLVFVSWGATGWTVIEEGSPS